MNQNNSPFVVILFVDVNVCIFFNNKLLIKYKRNTQMINFDEIFINLMLNNDFKYNFSSYNYEIKFYIMYLIIIP